MRRVDSAKTGSSVCPADSLSVAKEKRMSFIGRTYIDAGVARRMEGRIQATCDGGTSQLFPAACFMNLHGPADLLVSSRLLD